MQDREAQFLDALYLGVRDRAGFDRSLELLCGLFDVQSAALLDFDAAQPEISVQGTVGLFSGATLRRYQQEFAAIDPAPPAFATRTVGTAIPTYRLLAHEMKKPGVFFGEFFRPLGLEECLGGTLASQKGRFAMVGLHRAPERKPFDDADTARLEALMPHLARAIGLHRAFFELERKVGALTELCDRLAAGVVALDDEGGGIFANAAARAIAGANDGLSIDRSGRPFALDRDASVRLAELDADVRGGGPGGTLRVPRADGKPHYAVMVAPYFSGEGIEESRPRQRGVIFVIHDPLSRSKPAAETVAALFGLPPGAAALVAAIVADEELAAYAERAGISMNTVHYHMKSAYARIGVKRHSELVRLVTAAMRDLADHRGGG
jgi:PAS domain-containing protein